MPRHRTRNPATPTQPAKRRLRSWPRHRREKRISPLLTSVLSVRPVKPPQPDATATRKSTPHPKSYRRFVATTLLATAATLVVICLTAAGPAEAAAGPAMAVKTLPEVINSATAWIVGILATLGVFFFTVGGLRYMAAAGDPSEVEKAKGAFKGAAIGFALAVLAPVLMNIVKQIVGA